VLNYPKQERAQRTRRAILLAAASVFDECGYESASISEILLRADVTKGALYFHFPSKEALAQGVVGEQLSAMEVTDHELKLQGVIDLTLQVACRLRSDVLLRAGIRLTVEQGTFRSADAAPYQAWIDACQGLFEQARVRGELLPHVTPRVAAELVVGCFTGTQLLSQVLTGRDDVVDRVSTFWAFLLPGLAVPGILPHLRTLAPDVAEAAGSSTEA
jgi:AcrR family transcriptional regulator